MFLSFSWLWSHHDVLSDRQTAADSNDLILVWLRRMRGAYCYVLACTIHVFEEKNELTIRAGEIFEIIIDAADAGVGNRQSTRQYATSYKCCADWKRVRDG